MISANIEDCKDGILRGWAWDSTRSDEPVTLNLLIDNELLGVIKANLLRGDLAKARIGKGAHGFEFVVPPQFRDGKLHHVALDAPDNPPIRLKGKSVNFGTSCRSIQGRIEAQKNTSITGWAWDRAAPAERLELELLADEVVVATTLANRYRPDLARHRIGDGRHGFEFVAKDNTAFSGKTLLVRTSLSAGSTVIGNITLPFYSSNEKASCEISIKSMPELRPKTTSIEKKKTEPKAEIASPSDIYAENLAKALRRLRASPGTTGLFLDAKNKADLNSVAQLSSEGYLQIKLPALTGWMRVLSRPISFHEIANNDHRVRFSAAAITAPLNFRAVNICHFDPSGSFKLVQRLAKDIAVGMDHEEVVLTLRGAVAQQFDHASKADLPYFIFVEVDVACGFEIGGFTLEVIEKSSNEAPFKTSPLTLCGRLVDLNGRLTVAGRKNPVAWIVEQAELAVRFECFNTASRLVEHLTGYDLEKTDQLDLKIVRLRCEVYLAEGRMDELRDLLLSRPDLVQSDDVLATALSVCFPGDASLMSLFAKLPSGKLNRSYVARTKLSGELLRAAFFESADERREQHEIFVAETMRTLSQNSYKLWWNKYLDQQGLSSISAIDLTSKNVLSTIKFSRPSGITKGENEKISIIMSAYNSGSTAAYSIRSILEQTHENVEILICDDCSADNTLSEILRWKLPNRVRIFRSIANQGPYNIRNALIKEAEGEYITFQDADDFAHPERLERQLDRLKKSAAHSVIGRWVRLRPTGEVVFFRDHRCLRMSVVSIMARASLFRDQGPYRSVVCGADSEFLERLRVRFGKDALEEIDLPLIFGLWSEQSLTRSDGLEATEDGYRSKARRDYAEVAARQRLLGTSIIPDQEVERINRANGIFREFAGVVEL